jgi:hypothetical protein
MKRKTLLKFFVSTAIIISSPVLAQKKVFTLQVNQLPREQCIVNGVGNNIESQLKIFPNPTHGEFTISFGEIKIATKVIIQVFSIDGRLLLAYEEFLEKYGFQEKIDLTHLSKGMYLIKVCGKELLFNERIILY